MTTSTDIISYMQRRTSLSTETFIIPISLNESEVPYAVTRLAKQLLAACFDKSPSFQKKNYRSLIQKIEILVQLFESITKSGKSKQNCSVVTCMAEFYILLHRAKDLLIYCLESSRLRLLISNTTISSYFHDLDQEILCILDVITHENLNLNDDIVDLLQLIKNQLGKRKFFIDPFEESLKSTIFGFYEALVRGEVPNQTHVYKYFVEDLGIRDLNTWRQEIKSVEDMILRREREINVSSSVLRGFVALLHYSRLLISIVQIGLIIVDESNNAMEKEINQVDEQTLDMIPEDFLCPISRDLMIDPVTLATGQTFDRTAITDWFKQGNLRCPVTRTDLGVIILIPNKVVQSFISKWCIAQRIPYNQPDFPYTHEERKRNIQENSCNRAVSEANKAMLKLILDLFSRRSEVAQNLALSELRLLTERSKQARIDIVNAGYTLFLIKQLRSENHITQENSAVIIMYLSIHTENKIPIIQTQGSLMSILKVLQDGQTNTTREHAITTIHSLSMVLEYAKKFAKEKGLLKTLIEILTNGSLHDKINAMCTMINLSKREETKVLMTKVGVAKAMVKAMNIRGFRKMASDVLGFLVTHPKGAKKIRREKLIVIILTRMLQWGHPIEKESAAKSLLAFFMHGGSSAMRKSYKKPRIRDMITSLLQSHVPEERTKAARILRLHEKFQVWL
ncbi:U-box domain-containing protein 17-like [Silene latifolia]|uniref:U-box domain-containing protein 17-like n=1 Tax=Silene latifolia TaxID=37657 RepID=UPI003D7823AB